MRVNSVGACILAINRGIEEIKNLLHDSGWDHDDIKAISSDAIQGLNDVSSYLKGYMKSFAKVKIMIEDGPAEFVVEYDDKTMEIIRICDSCDQSSFTDITPLLKDWVFDKIVNKLKQMA